MLINAAEVIKRAAPNKELNVSNILPLHIRTAQDEHIRPHLGDELMDKLIADHDSGVVSGEYKTLLDEYLMDALACFVMYECEPHLSFRPTNSGIQQFQGNYSQSAITKDREYARNAYLKMGATVMSRARLFLEDSSIAEYSKSKAVSSRGSINGNIVIHKR